MRVLVIIPTYNEAENICEITRQILKTTERGTGLSHQVDILIVDDGSPDGTGTLADGLAKEDTRVHVLHRTQKQGLGKAYVAGFRWGLGENPQKIPYDALVEMDADFSHHPKYLREMVRVLEEKDFAIGSRYVHGGGTVNWGLGRKIISRGGSLYARLILGVWIRDFTGGFNGWNRRVLESIGIEDLQSGGYAFQIELKYRAALRGFSWLEFPIVFEDRKVGHSKMSGKIVIEALRRVWNFRWNARRFRGKLPSGTI